MNTFKFKKYINYFYYCYKLLTEYFFYKNLFVTFFVTLPVI